MSHVDEGTLHAYLDGALDTLPPAEAERVRRHLSDCDVCRARLEEERALRDEAAAILGGVPLELGKLPSFEETRARARRTSADAGFRIQKLAWAASVVLALGTGWMLRGGLPRPSNPLGPQENEAVRPTVEAPSGAPSPGSVAAEEREVAQAAEQDAPAAAPGGAPPVGGVAPTAPAPRSIAPAAVPPTAVTEEVETAKEVADRDLQVVSDATMDVAGGDSGKAALDSISPADLWAVARERQGQERLATQRTVQLPPAGSDPSLAGKAREPLADESRRVVMPAASAVPMAFAVPARGDVAEQEGTSLVVPGLSVVSVTWLEEPELAGAVRVLQLMASGDTLELVHLPAGMDPGLLPAVGDGLTQVIAPRDGGWLVARARASADMLSALLRRLEGGD